MDVVDCAFGAMSEPHLAAEPRDRWWPRWSTRSATPASTSTACSTSPTTGRRSRNYYAAVRERPEGPRRPTSTSTRSRAASTRNLRPQAESVGVGDRIPELKRMYAVVNEMLGDIVKVTPSVEDGGRPGAVHADQQPHPAGPARAGQGADLPRVGHRLLRRARSASRPAASPSRWRTSCSRAARPFTGRPGDTMPAGRLRRHPARASRRRSAAAPATRTCCRT